MDIKKYLLDCYIAANGCRLSEELAKGLVEEMAVTDGSGRINGEKYTIEQAKEIGDKSGISWESVTLPEYYTVLNMMYSDYYSVGKKHGLTDWPLFAEMSAAWFNDVDGKENKTFDYFFSC